MTCQRNFNQYYSTDAAGGIGIAYPSGAHEFAPVLQSGGEGRTLPKIGKNMIFFLA